MKNNFSKKLSKILLIVIFVTGLLGAVVQEKPVSAATQCLTGSAVEGNLDICVYDNGQMSVARYTSGVWVHQIYGTNSKGSRLYYSGGTVGLGYYSGTTPTLSSNTLAGNTITTIWDAAEFTITQITTYTGTGNTYNLQWNITNKAGGTGTISDLRFFHGQDTYLAGSDNGTGFWDSSTNTVGVQKPIGGVLYQLELQGVTAPYAYDSLHFSTVSSHVNANALTNTIDANVGTDNGYAMEWRTASLGDGSTWTIQAVEGVSDDTQLTAIYETFTPTNTASFNFVGNATNEIRLTEGLNNQFGAAWWKQQVTLGNNRSFTAYFSFEMKNSTVPQADGMTFTIQTQDNNAGSSGGGLGYAGISPSVAVEFDIYDNGVGAGDPNNNHVGIDVNGATYSIWTTSSPGVSLYGGGVLHAWVEYNGATDNFVVRLGTSNNRDTSTELFNGSFAGINGGTTLNNVMGENVYIGFTGSTGGSNSEHWVHSFFFNNDYITGGINTATQTYVSSPAIVEISASPTTISVGGAASTITACVKDSGGTPMPYETIEFATTAGSLSSSTAPSNESTGCGSVTLTSGSTPTTATVRASVRGGITNTVDVTFQATPPTSFSAASPSSGTYGSGYSYTFVANGAPAPTYSLQSGSLPPGLSLASNGTLSGTPTAAGTYSGIVIRATNVAGSLDTSSLSITINKASTSTTITSDAPDPTVYGQTYPVAVSVTSGAGIPAGTVTVGDGNDTCTITLSSGSGSCTLAINNAGTPTISAAYNGSANYLTSNDTEGHTINKADTTVVLSSPYNPAPYGTPMQLTAVVSAVSPSTATPDGQVQFKLDGANFGAPVTLSGGSATSQDLPIDLGTYPFTVEYLGTGNFNGSTSAQLDQVVIPADTTTVVVSNNNPSIYGEAVTFTATVSADSPSAAVPVGSVQFVRNGVNVGAAMTLNGSGQAAYTVPFTALWPQTHSITAVYSTSSGNFVNSSSTPVSQVVNKATPVISFTSETGSVVSGETFTAQIKLSSSPDYIGPPTGTVTVLVDGNPFAGPLTLTRPGGSYYTEVDVPGFNFDTGSHTVTVQYSGDDYFLSHSDDFIDPVTVNPADTSITSFTFTPASVVTGQAFTVNVHVEADAPGSGTPTGDVVISNGTDQCTATLDGSGNGSCLLTPTSAGQPDLTANYAGDSNFNSSSAGPISGPVVNKSDTRFAVFNFSPASVVTGQPVMINLSVESLTPGSGIPTGDVVVTNGTDQCTVTLDGNGDGSCILIPTHVGQPALYADYEGDDNYNSSFVGPYPGPLVTKANTTITLFNFTPSDVVTGQAVTVNVSVESAAPGSGIPTGEVVVSNGTDQCTVTLDENGDGTCQLIPTQIGQPDLTVNYGGDANYSSSSAGPLSGPVVTKADTSITTFTFDPAAVVTGEDVTINVTVESAAPGSGVPSGDVVISNGMDQCTATLDENGDGSCILIPTDIGQPDLTAAYAGDANYNPSAAGPISGPLVNKADTSVTTFTFTPAAVVTGEDVTINVSVESVAPGSGVPSGDVVISNGTDQCTAVLDGNGDGTCTLVPTAIGQPDLTANYGGDANYNPTSAGPISGPLVNKADTSITVFTFTPATVVVGEPVTINVTVESTAPGSGIPTGEVLISNGTDSDQCMATLDGNGDGTCQLIPTTPGQPDLTADYSGDVNYNQSSAGPISGPLVNKADTTIITVSSDNQSVYGQVINFTATVSVDAPGSGDPTGTVQFFINGTEFGDPVVVSEGSATSADISNLVVGNHTVRAEYSGDSNFNGSVSANINQEVVVVGTSLTLESDQNPAPYGESVTITATMVADDPSIAVPSGEVHFYINGVEYGSPVVVVNGKASKVLPYTALWVGTHNITAVYIDTTVPNNFASSDNISNPLAQVIGKAEVDVSFEASVNPSVFGQAVSFTITVVSHTGNITEPTGTVDVLVDGVPLGTGLTINGSQQAVTPSIDTLAVGDHTLTVFYSGDDQYLTYDDGGLTADPFVFTDQHTVNKADSSVSFDSISNMSIVVGQSTTVTVTVSAVAPGVGTPGGTVTISNGTDECEITLSSGSGNCDLVPSNIGSPDLTATYSGDANFNGVVSDPTTGPTVTQASTTTTIVSYDSGTIVVGEATQVSVTVTADAPGSGYPTGNVVVQNELGDQCTVTLVSGSGVCDLVPTAPSAGMTLDADYAGDSNYLASSALSVSGAAVIKADTEILNLSFNPTSAVIGQTITVSLTVGVQSPGSGTPSGTVSVGNGIESCEITLVDGAGSCTYQPSTVTSPGHETITLSYSGDSNFNGISPYTVSGPIVSKASVIVVIDSYSPTAFPLGESTNVQVHVVVQAPSTGVPNPLGTVSVTNGFDYCLATIDDSGAGNCDLTPTSAGQVNLQATYIGDQHYNSATSGQIIGPVVGIAPTSTTITNVSETEVVTGQPVVVSVSVTANLSPDMAFDLGWIVFDGGIIPDPTGEVLVSNGQDQCTAVLSLGVGSCTLYPSTVGSPSISAVYQGDDNYDTSSAESLSGPTVNPANVSIVSVGYTPENPVAGEPVTVTVQAQVDAPGTGTPGGTVIISNGTDSCEITLDETGQGSCELIPTETGQPDLEATFTGNDDYNPSTPYQESGPAVTQADALIIVSGPSSAVVGVSVQWTATVSAVAPSEGIPEGTVQFYVNGTPFGAVVTLNNGTAFSEVTSNLGVGSHVITAAYLGSISYAADTSDVYAFVVAEDTYYLFVPLILR